MVCFSPVRCGDQLGPGPVNVGAHRKNIFFAITCQTYIELYSSWFQIGQRLTFYSFEKQNILTF